MRKKIHSLHNSQNEKESLLYLKGTPEQLTHTPTSFMDMSTRDFYFFFNPQRKSFPNVKISDILSKLGFSSHPFHFTLKYQFHLGGQ